MQRQMCYVAGQVISDCVQKWGKNYLQCVTLLSCLPSCWPIASNNAAVSRAHCVALLYCSWGCPGRVDGIFVLASCPLLLLPVGNHWYSECVFISSPPPPLNYICLRFRIKSSEHFNETKMGGSPCKFSVALETKIFIIIEKN